MPAAYRAYWSAPSRHLGADEEPRDCALESPRSAQSDSIRRLSDDLAHVLLAIEDIRSATTDAERSELLDALADDITSRLAREAQ